jgi:hypothetical protein
MFFELNSYVLCGLSSVALEKVSIFAFDKVIWDSNKGKHTVKHRVGNEPTRINNLAIKNSQRFAIPSIQRACARSLALELITIHALYIAAVVLIEASEAVVQENRRLQIRRNVKLDKALCARRCRRFGGSFFLPLRCGRDRGIRIRGSHLVRVFWQGCELSGVRILTTSVVECDLADLTPRVSPERLVYLVDILTLPLPQIRRPPMGAKHRPTMNKTGRTVLGVRIGCQAFRRCCLKAVSDNERKLLTCRPSLFEQNNQAKSRAPLPSPTDQLR